MKFFLLIFPNMGLVCSGFFHGAGGVVVFFRLPTQEVGDRFPYPPVAIFFG